MVTNSTKYGHMQIHKSIGSGNESRNLTNSLVFIYTVLQTQQTILHCCLNRSSLSRNTLSLRV
jgi:hypothetical protein